MAARRFINTACSLTLRGSIKRPSQLLKTGSLSLSSVSDNTRSSQENYKSDSQESGYNRQLIIGLAATTGTLFGVYLYNQSRNDLFAAKDEGDKPEHVISRREQRFHDFASYEYNGQIVMSPQDFIESITENHPKLSRRGKIRVTELDLDHYSRATPSISSGSHTFLRDRHHNGIITYSEYLFLVTILTKSYTGLKTALKMMDVNGDKVISMEEFQLIVKMINKSASQNTRSGEDQLSTTLSLHLFGKNGDGLVTFDRFFKFMDDLQCEVLELEFHEYSKSMKTISEIDFAKILLRNTILSEQEYCDYLDRLKSRLESFDHPKGITLDQFKAFHAFLSNIEDFIIAVNMTNLLNQAVDKELFSRSIKVTTGKDIDPYVIDVVFSLFDQDGDGKLSQNEFIGIMKDRLKRGFGKFPNTSGFAGFKHCLKKEMVK